ncbi:MAG: hypothetical protein U0359_28415 [Byssovorax sp.]
MRITGTSWGGSASRSERCERMTGAFASASMKVKRSRGCSGSRETTGPPAFMMPRMPVMSDSEREEQKATGTSGPTPKERRWWARRLLSSSSAR